VTPRISSPLRGVTYTLRKAQATIALEAIADGDAHELFWFIGDELVGRTKRGESLFWAARSGAFQVRVVDDLGRSDERALRVERID
jgi:penicillin-binding protein 1C